MVNETWTALKSDQNSMITEGEVKVKVSGINAQNSQCITYNFLTSTFSSRNCTTEKSRFSCIKDIKPSDTTESIRKIRVTKPEFDILQLNCTAGKTLKGSRFTSTTISWFINGEKQQDKNVNWLKVRTYLNWESMKTSNQIVSCTVENNAGHSLLLNHSFIIQSFYVGEDFTYDIGWVVILFKITVNIGLFLSFLSLVTVNISFWILEDWPKLVSNKILVCHSFVLLVCYFTIILSFNMHVSEFCKGLSTIIHYSLISSFLWTTVEGICFICLLAKLCHIENLSKHIFLILGIACCTFPSIYVIPFTVFKSDIYENPDYSSFSETGVQIGLMPPLFSTLTINLGLTTWVLLKNKGQIQKDYFRSDGLKDTTNILAILVMLCIFGICSLLTLITNIKSIMFMFICIIYSFYGVLFLCRCIRDDQYKIDCVQFIKKLRLSNKQPVIRYNGVNIIISETQNQLIEDSQDEQCVQTTD